MRAKLKVILPLLLAIYIAVETILKANNIEVCSTTGCALAGELLKFNSFYLNYLGIAGALFLVVLATFKSNIASSLYTVVAAAMVIFESLLIASQINLNPEVCIFCLGVYSFLIVILINANAKVFAYSLPAIGALFLAFYILAIPQNKSLIQKDGLYLIASPTCPHCKKAKSFLNKRKIAYEVIDASDLNAFYFAKSLSIKQIPIAIKKSANVVKIYVGDKEIEQAFSSNSTQDASQKEQSTLSNEPFNPSSIYEQKEGCELSITATESDCEGK
jgi:glutaredoxin/uncharacterized membrane protein